MGSFSDKDLGLLGTGEVDDLSAPITGIKYKLYENVKKGYILWIYIVCSTAKIY